MTKLLDQSWKSWTKENLGLGVSHQVIFKTLVDNGFDTEDIVKNMDIDNLDSLEKKLNTTSDILIPGTHIQNGERIELKENNLEIYRIKNFLNKTECNGLVKLIKSNMKKSMVSLPGKGNAYIDESFRTSSTCNLSTSDDELVKNVDEKILECIGIHQSRGESIQGQYYDVSQEFKAHTDTFQPNSDEYEVHCKTSGQRTWTFMIYLNNTKQGGETKFQKLQTKDEKEVILKPKLGDAIVWNNLNKDGKPNPYSLHQGCPVKEGYKCIITKWFREKKI